MSDTCEDRHHHRHTSMSSHPAGQRTKQILNPQTQSRRRPALEKLGPQPQNMAHTQDLREQLNTKRQADLRERLNSKHEQEVEISAQGE